MAFERFHDLGELIDEGYQGGHIEVEKPVRGFTVVFGGAEFLPRNMAYLNI